MRALDLRLDPLEKIFQVALPPMIGRSKNKAFDEIKFRILEK